MRFRERHQDPSKTDLEYAAAVNGLGTVDDFVGAFRPPWFVSMVGFVAGLPFLYQMVERQRQIQVPKYLRPRTDTPKLTIGHGGCFGLHLFGARRRRLPDVRHHADADLRPDAEGQLPADFMCLFRPGDIVKWKPVTRDEYDAAIEVEAGRFEPVIRDATFEPDRVQQGHGRHQCQADGGDPWPLRSSLPGLSTTVQDLGRPGYYHLGIPISGGMDRFALRAANMLVGNDEGAAVLEAVFMGPELEFTAPATVAVTGADLPPKVERRGTPGLDVSGQGEGDRLSFGFLKAGARAYIAVSGGIDVPVKLGSRSTYTLGALGGTRAALKAGDNCRSGAGKAWQGAAIPGRLRRKPGQPGRTADAAGPLLAPHHGRGGQTVLRRHLEGGARGRPHRLPLQGRHRAGVRAARTALRRRVDPSNIVDACYPYGSIQVPGGTEPIVCTAMRCRAAAT
jgi:allophanate hydrolase subunit 2